MKKVLITGGNGDIAKAIANVLILTGEYIVVAPGKDVLDVTNHSNVEKFFSSFSPDILINNAGYVVPSLISENSHINAEITIKINLLGTFWCTAAALSHNKQLMVINIGSSAGTKVHADWSGYCASKAAVIMATECWAKEGLQTICISPGRTKTKMRKFLYPVEDENTLLTPEEFAQVVLNAIHGKYEWGSNIKVSVDTIKQLLEQ